MKDSKHSLNEVGGKAFNLIKLQEQGFNIPTFITLSKSIMLNHLKGCSDENILDTIESLDIEKTVFEIIDNGIPNAKEKIYAIRSSASNEDGAKLSFAGQYTSYLYVEYNDIPHFIKQVWKSVFSDQVKAYYNANQIEHDNGIAVIIQEMIDPDVSGVAFGINPNTGTKDSKIINAVYGVGEGLVSGELNSDNFIIEQEKIEKLLVKKERKAIRLNSGKITYELVQEEKQYISTLSDSQINKIVDNLNHLNEIYKVPQDIEFAFKDGVFHLLQCRPITAVFNSSNHDTNVNRIIWDNSNIIESYPGVTTPLTFSYILNAYRQVYSQLARIFGVSKKTISNNQHVFNHMLGLINGQVYYNLFSWYRMLSLFPLYKLNARFMENMMGVKERFDLPKQNGNSKFAAALRTVWMIIRILAHMVTIKKQTKKYQADVNKTLKAYKKLNLEKMSAYELMKQWKEFESYLTSRWKAPILTDSFALYYFGRLQNMLSKVKSIDNPNIHNDLLCGSKDIISVEPIHLTIKLATFAQEDLAIKELFLKNDTDIILSRLNKGEFASFFKQIQEYIEKFGDRCVGELKLETISYKENPQLYLSQIKSFVKQGVTSKSTTTTVEDKLRKKAEKEVKKAFKYNLLKRWRFNTLLNKTRFLVSNRENLRYDRTRVFGLTREMFSQIGKEFEKANVLEHYRDIYYLTMEEMFAFIEGCSVTKDLKPLVNVRKKEFLSHKNNTPPSERFTTYDAVNYRNNFYDTSSLENFEGDLKGIGCSPGIVKAKVQVIHSPSEVKGLNGDILVTSSTDPGWVTLFPTAGAIVVERGSLLSHSAIVSREMGIPCIVGVTGLLKTLKTGDVIEMNGSTGEIKILTDE